MRHFYTADIAQSKVEAYFKHKNSEENQENEALFNSVAISNEAILKEYGIDIERDYETQIK